MNKIPTVFVRDENNRRYVTNEVTPGCEWVLAHEGVATRKYDGTCVMFDGERWWARREVKTGKETPEGFVPIENDDVTGKTVGWEPVEQSGFAKFHAEAVVHCEKILRHPHPPGTYELCGPKVNGNPEHYDEHLLIPHGKLNVDHMPRDFDGLKKSLTSDSWDAEGIVWHHPDGRMAKIKKRDFPRV